MDIDNLDLRVLGYLEALVTEGSVSKAAARLGMSQPGLSSALAKLRVVVNDPLLVRTAHGMEPTPCGLALAAEYAKIKDRLQAVVSSTIDFDHRTSERVFRVECMDYALANDVANVIALLREHAPNVRLMSHPILNRNFREHLETGFADLIIGYLPELDGTLRASKLRQVSMSCVAKLSHPRIDGVMDEETYLSSEHIGLMLSADGIPSYMESGLDAAFRARGRTRHVPVVVQSQFVMPHMAAKTDLIGTLPTDLAKSVAAALPIQVLDFPFTELRYDFVMVWHSRSDKDPAHRWLRALVRTMTVPSSGTAAEQRALTRL